MHTVHQRWLVQKKVYSYAVQFVEPSGDRTVICLFRNHLDAYGFCAWLNGGSEPDFTERGRDDLYSWSIPPAEEMEE